jgi:hypothetical protein
MEYRRLEIPIQAPVKSLCWYGESLIDWGGGNRVYALDGKASYPNVNWSYRFDAAVQSPSGRYAAIYERLGTKAVLLDRGKFLRELNRSFYHAGVYEYPIVLFEQPDGRELIAHCPDQYHQLEIDEVATGKRLTGSLNRKPADFFHSRLAVSPDQSRLLSAGWIWHPFDSASTWSIAEALADGRTLDVPGSPGTESSVEINGAIFVDANRVLVSSNPDADDLADEENSSLRPGHLAIFNLESKNFEIITKTEQPIGTMLWLGDGRIISFYETPKVIDVDTGRVICRWPDIATGKQSSSIIHHVDRIPALALDSAHKRFAVASNDRITVVQL